MRRFLRSKAETMADADLLALFQQQGDKQALAALFDRYVAFIYGLCLQYLPSPTHAEDATMAIYAELQEKLPRHEVRNFKNWLHTFARNHCLMQLRREKNNPTANFDPAVMQFAEDWHPLDDAQVAAQDRQAALDICLEQLGGEQKQGVQLFYYEGHSYKAIAELLGMDVGLVRSHIQNGRRNLKKCIEAQEQRLE
jgi:RNA polymerase sigma factor (sigma-70 family)